MPPHSGHCYLLDFASSYCSDLTLVVGSLATEPIPGELRYEWMRRLYPDLNVVHLTDENPQYPDEHSDFWSIWKTSLEKCSPKKIDYLFASEDYGAKLAEVLGAQFIPCNDMRGTIDVSATEIRNDPGAHWHHIPHLVRPFFCQRILIFGPESTGKSTLARQLAEEFGGALVPEYARTWLQGRESDFSLKDMEVIARGQWASEEAAARRGLPWVFCDTDPLTTAIWCQELFGEIPESVSDLAAKGDYDLTLLLDVDVPWVEDSLRLRPENREEFLNRCRAALERARRPYKLISGDWEERLEMARQALR